MTDFTIAKGNLHFQKNAENGYICKELTELNTQFSARWTRNQIAERIEVTLQSFRNGIELRYPTPEIHDRTPETQRKEAGRAVFDRIVSTIKERTDVQNMDLLQTFLFWHGISWWFYNPEFRTSLTELRDGYHARQDALFSTANEFLTPALPEQVRNALRGCIPLSTSANFGHFAILYGIPRGDDRSSRFIVTDQSLFQVDGMHGYTYIDVLPDGKPVARSRCDRGGGRAFFDGVRLMSLDKFETCAPKTVAIENGYKVNSTNCTIVNGSLFPLIDDDDAVARTTGAFMGLCEFTNSEAAASHKNADERAGQIRAEESRISYGSRSYDALGRFLPSKTELLDNGFAKFAWSEYQKVFRGKYARTLAVDDNAEWLEKLETRFGTQMRLSILQASDRRVALDGILRENPDCLLLDMHLTSEEEFDGLWIANNLFNKGFKGALLICSSYGTEALEAMRKLIKGPTLAPGKDLEKIARLLSDD